MFYSNLLKYDSDIHSDSRRNFNKIFTVAELYLAEK